MKARKARRVRLCQCPYCQSFVPLSPKFKGEDYGLTVCEACFLVIDNRQVHSWLEDREAIPA